MIECLARFTANNVKVEAELSNGEVVEVYTSLATDGQYRSWWEYPADPQYGKEQFVEVDINQENAEPLYADEWEFVDEGKKAYQDENPDAFTNVKIVNIIKIKDATIDWSIDEDSLE